MTVIGQQLISSVRAHAAQNPDFVYRSPWAENGSSSCVYVYSGQPSCIIGCALWDMGFIDATLESSTDWNYLPVRRILAELELSLDLEEKQWLCDVQGYQDTDHSWREAVQKADLESLARAA